MTFLSSINNSKCLTNGANKLCRISVKDPAFQFLFVIDTLIKRKLLNLINSFLKATNLVKLFYKLVENYRHMWGKNYDSKPTERLFKKSIIVFHSLSDSMASVQLCSFLSIWLSTPLALYLPFSDRHTYTSHRNMQWRLQYAYII